MKRLLPSLPRTRFLSVCDGIEYLVPLDHRPHAAGVVDVRVGKDEQVERFIEVGAPEEELVDLIQQLLCAVELVV